MVLLQREDVWRHALGQPLLWGRGVLKGVHYHRLPAGGTTRQRTQTHTIQSGPQELCGYVTPYRDQKHLS